MKKWLASIMLFVVTLGLGNSAFAVVVPGSSYTIYIAGEQSGNPLLTSTIFDDEPGFIGRDQLVLALSESETTLAGGNSRITLNVRANGDLFPLLGEGAYMGVGLFDMLDLAASVFLYDARVTLRDLAGNVVFASDNLAQIAVVNAPWDGSFPSASTTFLIGEIGGLGVSDISFDFFVTEGTAEVPEPGSVLLCGIGLLAVWVLRHKRRA